MAIQFQRTAPAWRALAATVALTAVLAAPTQAALVSPVTLNLIAPGGVVGDATPISETASVNPATGLHAGDAGNLISSFWMLPGESITFQDNAILLHVLAGSGDATAQPPMPFTTGYLGLGGVAARYEFAGLQVAGNTIVGYTLASATGISSGATVSLASASQLNFDLSGLVFDTGLNQRDVNGYYYADFKIDLLTSVNPPDDGKVPEPASWALVLGALAALRLGVRRQLRQPAC